MRLMLVFIASVALAMATGVEEPSDEECCGKVDQCLTICRRSSKMDVPSTSTSVPPNVDLPPASTSVPPTEIVSTTELGENRQHHSCEVVKANRADPRHSCITDNCSLEALERTCDCMWVVSRQEVCTPSIEGTRCVQRIQCL